jgi:flagellar basal-body rod protein FlgF
MQSQDQTDSLFFQPDKDEITSHGFDAGRNRQSFDGQNNHPHSVTSGVISTISSIFFEVFFAAPELQSFPPHMDNLSIAAVSGLRSRMQSLDLLANNLANSATSGYKSDREYYGLYSSSDSENGIDGGVGASLPVVEKQWTDFSPGVMQTTGNPLDVALDGKGFFSVNGPQGPLYTRNGSLKVLPSGELATGDGYALRSAAGSTISVAAGKPINITREGNVQQDGQTLGQIGVVDFGSTDSLQKVGSSSFRNTDPKIQPAPVSAPDVEQGKIEASNVPVAYSAMRLVGIMRQFEMLQKAIGISSEMDTKSIQEVARVGA